MIAALLKKELQDLIDYNPDLHKKRIFIWLKIPLIYSPKSVKIGQILAIKTRYATHFM